MEFAEPQANRVWPLVFIALDYHAVNMHLEWILTVRRQQGKVKVSDNGCTGCWGLRERLLAVLDHFYVDIFLRTAGLAVHLKKNLKIPKNCESELLDWGNYYFWNKDCLLLLIKCAFVSRITSGGCYWCKQSLMHFLSVCLFWLVGWFCSVLMLSNVFKQPKEQQ